MISVRRIRSHRIDFSTTPISTNWYHQEISEANNLASEVIFTVQSVNLSLLASNQLACWDDTILECVYPMDDLLKHEWAITARNGGFGSSL